MVVQSGDGEHRRLSPPSVSGGGHLGQSGFLSNDYVARDGKMAAQLIEALGPPGEVFAVE